ncbi:sulfotransferase family protein [Shewanella hafniensis]|uniref:sulfotransferase family protein n=1 Tax=Shewanella hafniensis TaxID=365590 RepID=UPI001BBF1294|nr:sulfotransferase family protein [Shewanella hafniensis]MCL1134814.1 sulfotransferase family protein [Shewanella hafniensis]GIU31600.1 sulfotransferase family protein [Shewanella hafniensis]
MPDNANNSTASAHAQCSANAQHIGNADYAANTQHTGHSQIATPAEMNPANSNTLSSEQASVEKQKVFIIGLPRTGTTSVSVALLEQGLKVAHMAFTKQAFMLADAISDVPCFSDYRQLDGLFPQAKFVYLERDMVKWVPSMQMLLGKMLPHLEAKSGRFHPIMKRSFRHTFAIDKVAAPADEAHLIDCYQRHQNEVLAYFQGREDFISLDISHAGSLSRLLQFLGLTTDCPTLGQVTDRALSASQVKSAPNQLLQEGISQAKGNIQPQSVNTSEHGLDFPKLNAGTHVAAWHEYKHPNKVNSNSAGPQSRKFFDYTL